MSNAVRTYRNRINGAIGVYPEALARVFPNLEEVAEDAKPLAYVPITEDQIEQVVEATAVEPETTQAGDEPAARTTATRKGRR
ncbi:hypothetical protein [Agromyces larvae]|uniref:Uncharacterized protein n=1 Tax=Agromyces larvae TaxID=2929802 RepID=A0ABY4C4I8_9MICO|nr:hypothetical protein [Agromyces larvae]UOE45884.1 hypothetical protein MTO99_09135 [Agromyces larvae]